MRAAGRINRSVHRTLGAMLAPGVRTRALAEAASEVIRGAGGAPAFRAATGFPADVCISVNEEVGHGIPGDRVLRDGDVVKLDVGVSVDGMHTDAATTWVVGDAPTAIRRFVAATEAALCAGLCAVRPGRHLSDVSAAIAATVRAQGFHIVRHAYGHGIGRDLHEDPQIPNFGPPGLGPRIRPGMALAIEPLTVFGAPQTAVAPDGWTRVTRDGQPGAHVEHTVWVGPDGLEVLTGAEPAELWARLAGEQGQWRPACPADDDAIVRLAKQEMDSVLLAAWGRPARPDELLRVAEATTWVLSEPTGALGGFCTYRLSSHCLHLHTLVLDRRWHGTGTAQRVLETLRELALGAGRDEMELCVQTTNARAQRFYEKLGFREIGRPTVNTRQLRLGLQPGVVHYA